MKYQKCNGNGRAIWQNLGDPKHRKGIIHKLRGHIRVRGVKYFSTIFHQQYRASFVGFLAFFEITRKPMLKIPIKKSFPMYSW